MTSSFHPEAEAEFNGAIDYSQAREAGLGYDLAFEVYSAIQRIVAWKRRSRSGQFPPGTGWPARSSRGQIYVAGQTGTAVPGAMGKTRMG
jgi:hypothetical protein